MRVLVTDPVAKAIREENLGISPGKLRRLFGCKPTISARLPNADRVLAGERRIVAQDGFSIGGRNIVGGAIVVGKKDEAGEYTPPRTEARTIGVLVKWVAVPRVDDHEGENAGLLKAILVDPETGNIEEKRLEASELGMMRLLGGPARMMGPVTEQDAVWTRSGVGRNAPNWQKDGLRFYGTGLVVGYDRFGRLADVAADVEQLRASVEFNDGIASDLPSRPNRGN